MTHEGWSSWITRVWQLARTDGVPRRSALVALVVGSILNLINQPDAIFGSVDIDWAKAMLTFAVPYCVSTYGAVSGQLALLAARRRAGIDSNV